MSVALNLKQLSGIKGLSLSPQIFTCFHADGNLQIKRQFQFLGQRQWTSYVTSFMKSSFKIPGKFSLGVPGCHGF